MEMAGEGSSDTGLLGDLFTPQQHFWTNTPAASTVLLETPKPEFRPATGKGDAVFDDTAKLQTETQQMEEPLIRDKGKQRRQAKRPSWKDQVGAWRDTRDATVEANLMSHYPLYVNSVALSNGTNLGALVLMPPPMRLCGKRGETGRHMDWKSVLALGGPDVALTPTGLLSAMEQNALTYLAQSERGAHLRGADIHHFMKDQTVAGAFGTLVGLLGAYMRSPHSSGHLNRAPDDGQRMYAEQFVLVCGFSFDGVAVRAVSARKKRASPNFSVVYGY